MEISNKSLLVATIATVLGTGAVQGTASSDTTDSAQASEAHRATVSDSKMYINSNTLLINKELIPHKSQVSFDLWGENPSLDDIKLRQDAQVSINCNVKDIPHVKTLINKNVKQNISLSLKLHDKASPDDLKSLVQPLSQLPSVSLVVDEFALKLSEDENRNAIFLKEELEKIGKSVNLVNGQKKSITNEQLAEIKASLKAAETEANLKKERNAHSVTIDKYGKIDTSSDRIAAYPKKALGLASVATDIHVNSVPEHNDAMNSFLMHATLKQKAKISMSLNPENITAFITFIEKNKDLITSLTIELRGNIVNLANKHGEPITDEQLAEIKASLKSED